MPNSSSTLQELRALANLIHTSLDKIENACKAQDTDFPSLHEPFNMEKEGVRMSSEVMDASGILESAASQLIAAVRLPTFSVYSPIAQVHVASCLGIAIQAHVPEILRDAGPKGLHVNKIAAPTGVNANKLGRALRLLVANYIFREVAPDVFANNCISSSMDVEKDVKDIVANPEAKYDSSPSMTAMLEDLTTDGIKIAAYFADHLFDQKSTNSGAPTETAFNLAFKTNLAYFDWLSKPEQAYKSKRFATGMHAANNMSAPGLILKGFDWASLPKDSVVVDVAGGVGTQTMVLAKEFTHLKHVVQDRKAVIESDAPKFWEAEFPEAISSGKVTLQVYDMFGPQPVREPAVFFLREVTHDWSDEYCVKFLSQLRAAAGPKTQLIVTDIVLPYACADSEVSHDISGANSSPTPPAPLLPNSGAASVLSYLGDIIMLTHYNGSERTIPTFVKIFEQSGWKLVRVHAEGADMNDTKLIGVPV